MDAFFFELSQNTKHKSTNYAVFQKIFANVVFQNLIVSPRCSLFLFFFFSTLLRCKEDGQGVELVPPIYFFYFFLKRKRTPKIWLLINNFRLPQKEFFCTWSLVIIVSFSVLFLFFCRVFSFFSLLTVVEKNLQIFNNIQKKI